MHSRWDAVALPLSLTLVEVAAASDLQTRVSIPHRLSSPVLNLSTGVFWDGLLAFYSGAGVPTVS